MRRFLMFSAAALLCLMMTSSTWARGQRVYRSSYYYPSVGSYYVSPGYTSSSYYYPSYYGTTYSPYVGPGYSSSYYYPHWYDRGTYSNSYYYNRGFSTYGFTPAYRGYYWR